jgi:hypothetical protein
VAQSATGCLDASARPSPSRRWSFYFADTAPISDLSLNRKENPMPSNTTSALRKYWRPALVTGAGGTSLIIWFEEILLLGLDILAVLALLLLAGPIYLFNHFVFKSVTPALKDKNK